MQANEFKAWLTMLNMSQHAFAQYIGVSLRTVQYWLNERVIPEYAVLSLKYLLFINGIDCPHQGNDKVRFDKINR